MRLKEQSSPNIDALPLASFREHLRLATSFGTENLQDTILEASLRAAMAAIEARTGKALLQRTFIWQVDGWRQPDEQPVPIAPVVSLSWAKTVGRTGDETPIDLSSLVLRPSTQRPTLLPVANSLPHIPVHGFAEIGFIAGYAADWTEMPADLAQAVLITASHFYENRHSQDAHDGNLPFPVAQLIERHRTVRILGGTAA